MKKHQAWILYMALATGHVFGEQPASVSVVERGQDARVSKRVFTEQRGGRTLQRTNSFVELASGLHYWENGQWNESRDEIDIVADGAEATKGPHKVHFNGNINTVGAITITTSDQKRLRANVLGLGYTDTATGQSILIAQIKDSVGELLPPNQIVYPNAFVGVLADVRYAYTKAGFEQDVILRNSPPSPEKFGLNPDTTLLEVWTEFVEAPEPSRQIGDVGGLYDESLQFGSMRMMRGSAFALDTPVPRLSGAPVGKTWLRDGRHVYLIESVRHNGLTNELRELPQQQAALQQNKNSRVALLSRIEKPKSKDSRPVQMALDRKSFDTAKGLVLDFVLYAGNQNDFTFQSDTTYLVTGIVNFFGNVVFEGGTVVKYATTNLAVIQNWSNVVFQTDQYRPAIFTSQNDRSIGVDFYAANTPTNFSQALAMSLPNLDFHHLRISYADYGLHTYSMKLRHAQFTHCDRALYTEFGGGEIDNVLFADVNKAFSGQKFTNAVRHVTVNRCMTLTEDVNNPANSKIAFTNSLLVNVTNNGAVAITTNATVTTTSTIFQTVGAGEHYLAENSPYRDAGVTNIPVTLAADLKKRTTFPPTVIAPQGYYGQSQTLTPRAQRDTDLPDLGYHYDPIDYALSYVYLTNATLQVNAGTAVAFFNPTNSGGYGLALGDGGKFYCDGRADAKVNLTYYPTVQEMANNTWAGAMNYLVLTWNSFTVTPELRWRFTDISVMGQEMPTVYGYAPPVTWSFADCQFHGGTFSTSDGPAIIATNCLFNRVYTSIVLQDTSVNRFHNCTYVGGIWETYWDTGNTVSFTDNLFAGTDIQAYTDIPNSRIGYTTNCTHRLITTNVNDVVVNALAFQTGALGSFYLPTNAAFINAGSMNATNARLYHYTTTPNQVKETNSVVDIGFHYVATGSGGIPLDGDGDGTPDYLEDKNGNGIYDVGAGETDWKAYNSLNSLGTAPGLQVFTPLK